MSARTPTWAYCAGVSDSAARAERAACRTNAPLPPLQLTLRELLLLLFAAARQTYPIQVGLAPPARITIGGYELLARSPVRPPSTAPITLPAAPAEMVLLVDSPRPGR